jgi:hypothetical protein
MALKITSIDPAQSCFALPSTPDGRAVQAFIVALEVALHEHSELARMQGDRARRAIHDAGTSIEAAYNILMTALADDAETSGRDPITGDKQLDIIDAIHAQQDRDRVAA